MKYWISVVSKDLVLAGMAGGYAQATGERAASLDALRKDDVIFFYSPGTLFRAGTVLQAFTAAARVADDMLYQPEVQTPVRPWRLNVAPIPADETPIEPLLPQLAFVRDKANWGASLPRGVFEIGEDDARVIAAAMHADIAG